MQKAAEKWTTMIKDFVCVDVETTGLNSKEEKIIEIGAVKVINGIETGRFQSFIYPGRKLDKRIVALTGITDEMLADAPAIGDVMTRFRDFCGDLPVMGHNLSFDYGFIKRAMVNEKMQFEKAGVDTLKIARKYLTDLESRSLEYLCKYFGIEHRAHRALGDALATVALYWNLCEKFEEQALAEGSTLFMPAMMHCNVKRSQPITVAQKEQVKRYCDRLGLKLNTDIEAMSRAEASRFIEKYRMMYKSGE